MMEYDEEFSDDDLNGAYEEYNPNTGEQIIVPASAAHLASQRPENALRPEETSLLQKRIRESVVNDKNDEISVHNPRDLPQLKSKVTMKDLCIKGDLFEGIVKVGYRQLTNAQGYALSILMNRNAPNVLVQSQSGTGKTTAFIIAMLNVVVPELKFPQALCIAPTVELAKQISEQTRLLATHMKGIQCLTATKEVRVLPNELLKAQIVVGTPGTIMDWVRSLRAIDLGMLGMFILDEADVMLSMNGFIDQAILLIKLLSPSCKIGLFSATYHKEIMNVARVAVSDLVEFTLKPKSLFMGNLLQYYSVCKNRLRRFEVIQGLMGQITVGKCIIFCKTRHSAQWIGKQLQQLGVGNIKVISGDMSIEERADAIINFKLGYSRFLIATNVVARGIDIEGVNLIINYDLPMDLNNPTEPDYDTYVHRVGRAGRLGIQGMAINLISNDEKTQIAKIMNKFDINIRCMRLDEEAESVAS